MTGHDFPKTFSAIVIFIQEQVKIKEYSVTGIPVSRFTVAKTKILNFMRRRGWK